MINNYSDLIDDRTYFVNIYQNKTLETIFIENSKPVKLSVLTKYRTDTNTVEVPPLALYAHIPTDDDGEIFVSNYISDIKEKIENIIQTRKKTIMLLDIVLESEPQKQFQDVDREIERIRKMIQDGEFNHVDKIDLYGRVKSDIGLLQLSFDFEPSIFDEEKRNEIIRKDFESYVEQSFASEVVKRINAEEIDISFDEINSLWARPEREEIYANTPFLSKLFYARNSHKLAQYTPRHYYFRAKIEGEISPIVEIVRHGNEKFNYSIVKRDEFMKFLEKSQNNFSDFTF